MAFISSIEVTLWKAQTIGVVLPLLHASGWRFWEDEIRYKYFLEVGEEELVDTASPEQWPNLVAAWEEQCQQGRTVEVMYQWQENTDQEVTVWFSRKQEYLKIEFIMYPAWRRLCGNITDYSWYLQQIVCPLEQNGCGVLWVTCSDDNA